MTSCEKAAVICNKAQYNEASFLDKLKLRFHLFACKNCTVHSEKNAKLTSICEKAKLRSLSEQEKVLMKEFLKKES
ncbi:hypothetical protein JQC67_08010 [Aurantibacter crassamenti]|uniref:hypothetical protein n=1 Tax=Aurantibacter crassamenti TaxID=1837375 RepID=UPI001939E1AE|nr:hypothetical protein [Aurantibacter crassamenti]MBM1106075.1 hypothetical protein [Aurantibacter crassamenti]